MDPSSVKLLEEEEVRASQDESMQPGADTSTAALNNRGCEGGAAAASISQPSHSGAGSEETRLNWMSPLDKEIIRTTILKQEATFRQQLQELHRLYQVQKQLMSNVDTQQNLEQQGSSQAAHYSQRDAGRPRGTSDLELPAEDLELTLATGCIQKRREDGSFVLNVDGNMGADDAAGKEKDEGRSKTRKMFDKMQIVDANAAARAAVGGDDIITKWQLMADQARQSSEAVMALTSKSQSAASPSPSGVESSISTKDLIASLEKKMDGKSEKENSNTC